MSFKLGIQLYTVRKEAEEDLGGTLRQIKAMGYDGVELAGLYEHTPEEVRDLCAEIGLTPIGAHCDEITLAKDPYKMFGEFATIGCKYVAVAWLREPYRPTEPAFEFAMDLFTNLGKIAKKFGITMLYHNHWFEFSVENGILGIEKMFNAMPASYVGTEFDMGWVSLVGIEPAYLLKRNVGRVPIVHVKDFVNENVVPFDFGNGEDRPAPHQPKGTEFRPLGQGSFDMPALLAAARDAGTEWIIVEQDQTTPGKTPLECAAESISYLKTLNV